MRQHVVTIAKVELGRWVTERNKAEAPTESRHVRVTLSDGKVHETNAVVAYERGERERMMDGIMDPEKALVDGDATSRKIRQRVYDRRARAVERVLALFQKRFGSLPRSVELEDESGPDQVQG